MANNPDIDRSRRIGELIKRELAVILAREMNDSRVQMMSVSEVRLSKDKKNATVYVSSLLTNQDHSESVAVLNKARGFIRTRLSQATSLRRTPNLFFEYDTNIEKGFKLSRLIDDSNPS